MKFNPDDPKWSAYLLDELTADERAAVEQELETSVEAREFLDIPPIPPERHALDRAGVPLQGGQRPPARRLPQPGCPILAAAGQ